MRPRVRNCGTAGLNRNQKLLQTLKEESSQRRANYSVSSMSTGTTNSGCSKEMYELVVLSDGHSVVAVVRKLHKGCRSKIAMDKRFLEGQKKRFNHRPVGSWEFCWQGQFIIVKIMSEGGGFRDAKVLEKSKVNEMNLTGVKTTFAPPVPFSSPLRVSVSVENEQDVKLLYTGMRTVESPAPPTTKMGGRTPVEHTDTPVEYQVTHQQVAVPGIRNCMFLILLYYCYLNWRRMNSS
ncbi:uncharacterized protein LOC111325767 isoform X2 [Stylophora pistillata]|uniref:uncharacterized protein LOC111325767 isoform X2 n=1 Tax=Stylophora pistillata TaxID=50429 RepID=UPI000C04D0F7|nr:uncharacterized protein LOC111325767 isoform X2 [Stylophora pistillata]